MGVNYCECGNKEEYITTKERNPKEITDLYLKEQQFQNSEKYREYLNKFDKKIKYIGKYFEPKDFNRLIPDEARLYMTENVLDPSKHLKISRPTYQIKPVKFENGNIYQGNWNENYKMEGTGMYYLADVPLFLEGIWDDGILIYGRVFLPNGDFYEGEIEDSTFNGKGKMILANGEKYKGDFLRGEKTGRGLYEYPDGTKYEGEIVKGEFDGNGIMTWPNGVVYEGRFTGPVLNGCGKISNIKGEKYNGIFSQNLFHGRGEYMFENGDVYQGDFSMGVINGKGTFKRNDGFIFEGEWSNGKPNGFGKVYYSDRIIKGIWRNGKIAEEPFFEQGLSKSYINPNEINFDINKFNINPKDLPHLQNPKVGTSLEIKKMPSFFNDSSEM